MNRKYLLVFGALCAIVLLFSAPLEAKSKADKLADQGQAAESRQDWDAALEFYLKALDLKPGDAQYLIGMRRVRLQAGTRHVSAAMKLRADGKLEEALGEFQKALITDPSSSIAIQEIRRTQAMIEQQKKQPTAPEERGLTPADRVRRESDQRLASIQAPPELKPVLRTLTPLKINNQPPKVLFETIGKLAGVNVLFDSQYSPPARGFNLELGATTPEQAFDYLAVLTHTFWKPVAANAIFVTEDNPTKHRDYDDEVVKTFYIVNATSVQEFQEIATAIRTVADIRRVFTVNAQKALIIRAPVDAMALAEKLVHDLDKPKSEVVIDIIVMQANSSRTRDLAASIVNSSGTPGLNVPFVFTPRNPQLFGTTGANGASGASGVSGATGATGGVTATNQFVSLAQLGHLSTNDWSTSLPGALLNLMLSDSKNKILNSPTLRVSDGMTAELKVGQRIPYATGSFQPGVGTVGVSPLVSTQFNYIDTGVNIKIVPQVHSTTEVTLHVEVDISSVAQYLNLGGLSQPVIGQNKNNADLRMREGEVNILGGLSQLQDSKTVNGIPGLVDMPVLGNVFFGSNHTDKERGELMIAIIPHIVRTPDYSAENLRGIAAGTETSVKLTYAPRPEPAASAPPAEPPKPGVLEAPAAAAPPAPSSAPGQLKIGFSPASIQTPLSYPMVVTVTVDGASDLFSAAPLKIKFDPTKLRLNDITPGDLFTRDGTRANFIKDIRNDTGEATVTVARVQGSPGASGAGSIAVLNFVAVGKGQSTISVVDTTMKNSQGQAIPASAGSIPVTVQ
jgi:general secretion pathway protein D